MKFIGFDFDGTIIDSWEKIPTYLKEYSKKNNLNQIDPQLLIKHYGDLFTFDLNWGCPIEKQKYHLYKMVEEVDLKVQKDPEKYAARLFPNVHNTIIKLKDKETLGIITSRQKPSLTTLLNHHKIKDHFHIIRTHTHLDKHNLKDKPAPDLFLMTLKDLGGHEQFDTLYMVGDSVMDYKMSKNAGKELKRDIKFIGVSYGAHAKEHLAKEGVKIIIDDMKDLENIINN